MALLYDARRNFGIRRFHRSTCYNEMVALNWGPRREVCFLFLSTATREKLSEFDQNNTLALSISDMYSFSWLFRYSWRVSISWRNCCSSLSTALACWDSSSAIFSSAESNSDLTRPNSYQEEHIEKIKSVNTLQECWKVKTNKPQAKNKRERGRKAEICQSCEKK